MGLTRILVCNSHGHFGHVNNDKVRCTDEWIPGEESVLFAERPSKRGSGEVDCRSGPAQAGCQARCLDRGRRGRRLVNLETVAQKRGDRQGQTERMQERGETITG